MSRTKTRKTESTSEPVAVPASPQKADDKTSIDELAERKKQKEKLPDGFTKRLEGDHKRQITVDKTQITKKNGKPFKIWDMTTGDTIQTDHIKIESESESCVTEGICGPTGVGIITRAPILVGRCKR